MDKLRIFIICVQRINIYKTLVQGRHMTSTNSCISVLYSINLKKIIFLHF